MTQAEQEKKRVGEAAAQYIQSGMIVGLGTGSTAYYAIRAVGQMIREGLSIKAIPTSEQTRKLAEEENIPLVDFSTITRIDLTIDGADEADHQLALIKGGGGALLREKMIAAVSDEMIVIGDSSKLVPTLGQYSLPVEVTQFGWQSVAHQIQNLGITPVLREKEGQPYVTDNHNYILDCPFGKIEDPAALEKQLDAIPGVVINGLFVGLATRLLLAEGDSVKVIEAK